MPLYDYKCSKCGYVFEVQQRITEEPLKHCPKCKGHIKRLISAAGIIFKGSGFHVTDYGKGKGERGKGHAPKKKETKPKETKSSPEAASPPPSK
jgi:putative FmdB family regulatory protein